MKSDCLTLIVKIYTRFLLNFKLTITLSVNQQCEIYFTQKDTFPRLQDIRI